MLQYKKLLFYEKVVHRANILAKNLDFLNEIAFDFGQLSYDFVKVIKNRISSAGPDKNRAIWLLDNLSSSSFKSVI